MKKSTLLCVALLLVLAALLIAAAPAPKYRGQLLVQEHGEKYYVTVWEHKTEPVSPLLADRGEANSWEDGLMRRGKIGKTISWILRA